MFDFAPFALRGALHLSQSHTTSLPNFHGFLSPNDPHQKEDDGIRLFYVLWESKMRKLYLPETIGMMCCASYGGWLLLTATTGSEAFLLNPLTRTRIYLPPFIDQITRIWNKIGNFQLEVDQFYMSNMYDFGITKVTFSSDLTDPNCIIMVFNHPSDGRLFFCRVGDSHWTCYETLDLDGRGRGLDDAAYHNGSFYLFPEDGTLEIYDLSQHKVHVVDFLEAEFRDVQKFFLVKKSGLYLVAVHFDEDEDGEEALDYFMEWDHKQIVEMYKISEDLMEAQRPQCITDTSDTTIFYGDNFHYLAVNTADWDSLDGGCMYMSNAINKYRNKEYYSIFFSKFNDYRCQPVVIGIDESFPIRLDSPTMWFQPSFS